jgi:hypothetical protein
MTNLKKITAYTVYANTEKKYFWLRLRLEDHSPEIIDMKCFSMEELHALVDILRNEANTLFDIDNENIVIGWEPTGEHAPSH